MRRVRGGNVDNETPAHTQYSHFRLTPDYFLLSSIGPESRSPSCVWKIRCDLTRLLCVVNGDLDDNIVSAECQPSRACQADARSWPECRPDFDTRTMLTVDEDIAPARHSVVRILFQQR